MSVLIFALMRLVPGDPAVAVLGYKATPEGIRALREAFHLDEPLPTQYLRWLAGALRGDLGLDFRQNEPIGRMILDRLPVTIELTLLATLGAALLGIPLGLLGGARRGGLADRTALAVGLLGVSIPDFWLGIMLILGLALGVGLFPSGGWVPISEKPARQPLAPGAARADAGHRPGRRARPPHARRGARRGAARLRAVRASQGPGRARRPVPPRAAQRRHSRRDGARPAGRLHAGRRHRGGDDLHAARRRAG